MELWNIQKNFTNKKINYVLQIVNKFNFRNRRKDLIQHHVSQSLLKALFLPKNRMR